MAGVANLLYELTSDKSRVDLAISRLHLIKDLFDKNEYKGPYRDQFEDMYEEILDAKEMVANELRDGFQFSDLRDILAIVAPVLKDVYDEFYPTLEDSQEALRFLTDLLLFVYYEIEVKLTSRWKGLLRLVFKYFLAKSIAKIMKIAFDYVDGKALLITDPVMKKIEPFLVRL